MKKYVDFLNEVRKDIIDRLEEFKNYHNFDSDDAWYDIFEVSYELTECENAIGSWYCSHAKAIDDLNIIGFDHVFRFIKHYDMEYCTNLAQNADAEKIHCLFMLELFTEIIAGNVDNLDGAITLNAINELIENIKLDECTNYNYR